LDPYLDYQKIISNQGRLMLGWTITPITGERELICGQRGWLSKPFISFDARKVVG